MKIYQSEEFKLNHTSTFETYPIKLNQKNYANQILLAHLIDIFSNPI